MKKICIIGASGKLGRYMVQHALDCGYSVCCVCRSESISKLDTFKDKVTIFGGATNDRSLIEKAVSDCDGVLTVLFPWGNKQYATTTAQAVLDFAPKNARLIFSCGWHISRDGKDKYPVKLKIELFISTWITRLIPFVSIDDQVEACRRIFESKTKWTVVRGSDLEEGESQGLPAWSEHVGDPILESNLTRRIDFALFMVAALENNALIQVAPAIVGCKSPSALQFRSTS